MTSDEKPTPLWKKEISFRRKPARSEDGAAAEPAWEPVPKPEGPAAASASKSVWKREISFGKKSKAETPEPSHATQPEVAADPVPEPLPESDPELALALEAVLHEPEPTPEPKPEPERAIEHSWLTQPLEEVSEPPAEPLPPAAVAEEEPAKEPTEEVRAEAVLAEELAEPVSLVSEIEALDPTAEIELLAEVVDGFEVADVDVELPPLADADLPDVPDLSDLIDLLELPAEILPAVEAETSVAAPVAGAAPKVPFYKRELSAKRKPRERKPKAERSKRERPPKSDAAGKAPFYKRELSFKRGPQEWDAAEPPSEPKAKSEPKPKSESRFKLQLKRSEPKPKSEPTATSESESDSRARFIPKSKLRRTPRPKAMPGGARGGTKLVGLKIGGSQIAAARINNGALLELVQAVRAPLDHGIVVGGELRDPEALAVALKAFFNRHKLPKRGVRLGIANNRIGVRTFEIVGIDDPKQLANAIRFQAQEVLPIPLDEAVLDYQVLSESVNDEGQPVRRVLLVVAYRDLVDRYVYACQKAGLQLVGIDLEAFAILRAIAAPHDSVPGSERGALVAVSVGHDRSTFAVSDGRVCEFTRVLEWGGWALNVAIARALDSSPSEAEPVKRALSFAAGPVEIPEGFNEEQLTTAREAAKKQLQAFARELVSSLQFYQNQPGSLSIGEIALTGGTAHLPGLGAELERLIGVPVRVADPLTRLKMSNKVREQDQVGSLAVAIGLGIDD